MTKTLLCCLVFIVTSGVMAMDESSMLKIGVKIWHNEAQGNHQQLLSWNKGEPFASLGIGHFIWSPSGVQHRYGDSFLELLVFLEQSGVLIPQWLRGQPVLPWANRDDFLMDHGIKKQELSALLKETLPLQIQFIIKRFQQTIPKLVARLAKADQKQMIHRLNGLIENEQGVYVLIDYLNFKGEGLSTNPDGWGLLQVLEQMARAPGRLSDIEAFVWAADVLLAERAHQDPHAKKWRRGWKNRVYSYLN